MTGIDVGGTKIRWIFLKSVRSPSSRDARAPRWHIVSSHEIPTPRTQDSFIATLHTILAAAERRNAASVGIGIAGTLSHGILVHSPHLPFLKGMDFTATLRHATSIPCTIDNDARCAAYAEVAIPMHTHHSRATHAPVMLVATLGTGVGRAIVHNGILHTPASLENAEPWERAYRKIAALSNPSANLLAEFLGPRLARLAVSHHASMIVLGGGRLRTKGLFALVRNECMRTGFSGTIRRSHFRQNEGAVGAALLGVTPQH